MKKKYIPVALLLSVCALLPLESCIGSFALTHKVLSWNNQVGSKFLNELVFVAFWVLPVYEVTAAADLLVLNSIEFWSGNNPVEAYTKVVETEHGNYFIACDEKGYAITAPDGQVSKLDFTAETNTWSIVTPEGKEFPFMTMIDDSHVKMVTPDGNFQTVEISEKGLYTYHQMVNAPCMAYNK